MMHMHFWNETLSRYNIHYSNEIKMNEELKLFVSTNKTHYNVETITSARKNTAWILRSSSKSMSSNGGFIIICV